MSNDLTKTIGLSRNINLSMNHEAVKATTNKIENSSEKPLTNKQLYQITYLNNIIRYVLDKLSERFYSKQEMLLYACS
jgi:hypothetical protein